MSKKIDEKFDNAEKVVKRTQKLLITVVGSIVAIIMTIYLALDQIAPEDEYIDSPPIEYMEGDSLDTLGYDTEPYEMMTEE